MGVVPPVLYVATILILVGTILHIVAIFTPNWQDYTKNTFHVKKGIFRNCIETTCYDSKEKGYYVPVRALFITTLICGLVSSLGLLVFVVLKHLSKFPASPRITSIYVWLCAIIAVLAAIFCAIAISIFSKHLKLEHSDIRFPYNMDISAIVLVGAGGILVGISRWKGCKITGYSQPAGQMELEKNTRRPIRVNDQQ